MAEPVRRDGLRCRRCGEVRFRLEASGYLCCTGCGRTLDPHHVEP